MARRLPLFSSIPFCAALAFAQTAPPGAELPRIVRVEPGVLEQYIVSGKKLILPPLPPSFDVSTKAVLDLVVDETGRVRNVRAVTVQPRLREAALRGARNWTFSPPRVNGKPAIVIGRVDATFVPPQSSEEPRELQGARNAVREDPMNVVLQYELAKLCERTERYEAAIAPLKEALRLKPDFEEACILLAKIHGVLDNSDDRLATCLRFLEVKRNSPAVLEQLVKALLDDEDYGGAASALQKLEPLKPKDTGMLLLIGDVNARQGRFEDAFRAYDEAITFDPNNALLHAKLGAELMRVGQFKDAEEQLSRAIRLDPKLRAPYHSLGRLYGATRRAEKGLETYSSCIRNTHRDLEDLEEDYHVMGELLMPLKQYDRAEAMLNQALELKPDVGEIYCHLGEIKRLRGRTEEAIDVLQQGIKAQRDVPCLYGLLGHALTHLKRPKEAEDALRQAIKLAPKNPSGYMQLVELLEDSERWDEAISVMDKVRELSPNDYRVHMQLGEVYYRMGREADSEREMRAALRLRPTDPMVLNNVGYHLVEQGKDLEEALKMIERAVAADPQNGSYLDSLGWAHFKLGRLDLAEKYIAAALEQGEPSAAVIEHLGDVYMKQGKSQMALQKWQEAITKANRSESERLKQKLAENNKKN
jgi:tetratricopeptide (TPR) repeat protein